MPSLQSLGTPALLLNQDLGSVIPTHSMRWLERWVLGKWFRRERLSRGPNQFWLNRDWELRIGSVDGIIYKVGLETVGENYDKAVEFTIELLQILTERLGVAERLSESIWIWAADDGNVVLQLANTLQEQRVMVFLTSAAAKNFARR